MIVPEVGADQFSLLNCSIEPALLVDNNFSFFFKTKPEEQVVVMLVIILAKIFFCLALFLPFKVCKLLVIMVDRYRERWGLTGDENIERKTKLASVVKLAHQVTTKDDNIERMWLGFHGIWSWYSHFCKD